MLRVTSSKEGRPSGKQEEEASAWFLPPRPCAPPTAPPSAPGSDITRLLEPARFATSPATSRSRSDKSAESSSIKSRAIPSLGLLVLGCRALAGFGRVGEAWGQ